MHRSEGTKCEPTASGAPGARQKARRAMDGNCRQPKAWRAFCLRAAKARVPLEVIVTTSRPRNGAASGAMKVPHSNIVTAATKCNCWQYGPG
ncbi:hypothetical protein [Geofilum rubicundum]|uniref:hypothetical protein n=1 Tax=Geofilum rubicundum TaxID=472113 RepID=UPI0012F7FCB9|nr:hypothetical protein [Geofilum rubicundum]